MNSIVDCIQSSYHCALVLTVWQLEVWPTFVHFCILNNLGYQNNFVYSLYFFYLFFHFNLCFWCLMLATAINKTSYYVHYIQICIKETHSLCCLIRYVTRGFIFFIAG